MAHESTNSNARNERLIHFQTNPLPWLLVNHFLTAGLLRELFGAVVQYATADTFDLDDFFDVLYNGAAPFDTLVLRPKETTGPLEDYVKRTISSVIAAHDYVPPVNIEMLKGEEAVRARALEASSYLGQLRLDDRDDMRRLIGKLPAELEPFFKAIMSLANFQPLDSYNASSDSNLERVDFESSSGSENTVFEEVLEALNYNEQPLRVVLVKHLGDLCADVDWWSGASFFYIRAQEMMANVTCEAWADLTTSLQSSLTLSTSSAAFVTSGAKISGAMLASGIDQSEDNGNLTLLANGAWDADWVKAIATDTLIPLRGRHVAKSSATQVLSSLDLDAAFKSWEEDRPRDANRFFWATLRRQYALGSITATNETKSYYGRFVVNWLDRMIEKHRLTDLFNMGVRLLLESGDGPFVEKTKWTDQLIETYVTEESVSAAIKCVDRYPGTRPVRLYAAINLFKEWLITLPPEREGPATLMLQFLADTAKESTSSLIKSKDLARQSLDALKDVADKRPELVYVIADAVADTVIEKLKGNFYEASSALESVGNYIGAMNETALKRLIDAILKYADEVQFGEGAWMIVRLLTDALSSNAVQTFANANPNEGRAITSAIVHLNSEQNSENGRLLFILSGLEPEYVKKEVTSEQLNSIVTEVRSRARIINASNAGHFICALLAAPWASKDDGIKDAMTSILEIIESTLNGRPQISFATTYNAINLLTERNDDILSHVQDAQGYRHSLAKIFDAIVRMWERSKVEPMIFTTFAIPEPTRPHPTLIHNWAFSSVKFAHLLRRDSEVDQALDTASNEPLLKDAIAIARTFARSGVQAADREAEKRDLRSIEEEGKEAFYAALGKRLAEAQALDMEPRSALIDTLVRRTLRLGPHFLDAATFAFAGANGRDINGASNEIASYRVRLDNERKLRLVIFPLFNLLTHDQGS